jgi:hypothetical protein
MSSDSEKPQKLDEHINTDQRNKYDWKSRWCEDSRKLIKHEAIVIGSFFFMALILLWATWNGILFKILSLGCYSSGCSVQGFDQFSYIFVGGLFGGTIYGLKYLYKVVARGYWHLDRRLWRIFSPWLSAGVALAFGALFDSGIIGLSYTTDSPSGYFSIGFVTGYFADRAIAKLQEVAETMFGPSAT